MSIAIEKGVPVPSLKGYKYPFDEMEVGDSFILPAENSSKIRVAACAYQRKHSDFKFLVRKQDKHTVRCWRVSLEESK